MFPGPPDPMCRTLGKSRTDVARIGSNRHLRPSDIKELALEPLAAQGPADPWFRPMWEHGDDNPLPSSTSSPASTNEAPPGPTRTARHNPPAGSTHSCRQLGRKSRQAAARGPSAFVCPRASPRVRSIRSYRFFPGIEAQLPAQMREALRLHCPAILQQSSELLQAGRGEERPCAQVSRSDLDQAALQHTVHRRWDLRFSLPLTAAPGAQEDAVRDTRILAEVGAELAADQIAFARGEG
jgi:hypothetical protein